MNRFILLLSGIFFVFVAGLSLYSGKNIGFTAGGNHAGQIYRDSNPIEFVLMTMFQLGVGLLFLKEFGKAGK